MECDRVEEKSDISFCKTLRVIAEAFFEAARIVIVPVGLRPSRRTRIESRPMRAAFCGFFDAGLVAGTVLEAIFRLSCRNVFGPMR